MMNMKIVVFVPVFEDVVQDAEIFTGATAEQDAGQAFLNHTGVSYESFGEAEDRDELLRESDTIGSYIKMVEVPLKVVIEVRGGVADETEVPDGVEVEIIDHENNSLEDGQNDEI